MKRVLVIEDDTAIRSSVIDLLDVEGFTTSGAENGLTGVRLAREELPDLIICDIMMPGLNGYGVLDALRQDPTTAREWSMGPMTISPSLLHQTNCSERSGHV